MVFGVALAVRIWAATQITFPAPEDTAYYLAVARNLLDGRGLVSDAIWSYLTPPIVFPRPAFEIWLPLPTFLAMIPMAILGSTLAAAQWSPILVGATIAVLGWRLAADAAAERGLPAGRARTLALGAGLTAAVYLPLVLHSALPDSTMPFAALALAACLLMGRIASEPATRRIRTSHLAGIGLVIGLAALARNEAVWLAVTWLIVVWRRPMALVERARLVAVVGVVAFAVFVPWAIRDWTVFGHPLPGQALANALSLNVRDIFAWQDRPTLERYLDAGLATLIGLRITGIAHNLFSVLLIVGVPLSLVGLAGLPWAVRGRAIGPVVVVAALTFAATALIFPVATRLGTFLHAAGPAHVLIIISALLALDGILARLGGRLGWTRPVAGLAPTLTVGAALLLTVTAIPTFGADGRSVAATYDALRPLLVELGPRPGTDGAVITDLPIWLAEETGLRTLALPDESPASVLDLARRFPGTDLLVVNTDLGRWPAILDEGGPGAECFRPIAFPDTLDPAAARALAETRLYRVTCR